jgi:hypothetical protein
VWQVRLVLGGVLDAEDKEEHKRDLMEEEEEEVVEVLISHYCLRM